MEKLKSLIPADLKQMISDSTPDDLPHTCASLLAFYHPLPHFQKLIGELVDPEMGLCGKKAESALDFKVKGNMCFSCGDFAKALEFYSQALRFAPTGSNGGERDFLAKLYANRALSLHKLDLFEECKRDCDRAIVYDPSYVKAWYRRGKANASLKLYEESVQDLEAALNLNCSVSEERLMKEELEIILSMAKRGKEMTYSKSSELNKNLVSQGYMNDETCQIELQCVCSKEKGRGMASTNNIIPATLVHCEEPFAAIVMKHFRDTHCHLCFNELPANSIFCLSCATPSYCSERCMEQAGSEHRHECGGVNWPSVLPSDAVLAGRVMAKLLDNSGSGELSVPTETLDFAHNYTDAPLGRKLELHVYSVVLSYCLHHYFGLKFPASGVSASKFVILLSQIMINSMAVVHMKSNRDTVGVRSRKDSATENLSTCNIEQVRAGLAIYLVGRLFNHSCRPNIHAYFLSRKLFLRSTEYVQAGCPLEISYGPQVGQCDYVERRRLLKDQYSFECQCSGCLELNLSDIVIHAFHCSQPECFGAILANDMPKFQKVSKEKPDVINEVAPLLVRSPGPCQFRKGYCLSCGSYYDIAVLNKQSENAMTDISRLQHAVISGDVSAALLSVASTSLGHLRSVKHPYSKDIAQVEDIISEAYCLIGEFESALKHCKASVEIVKKLYSRNHVVVGNELVKLASIQLLLGHNQSALNSGKQLDTIFSLYYGSHAEKIYPYLEGLRNQCYQSMQAQ